MPSSFIHNLKGKSRVKLYTEGQSLKLLHNQRVDKEPPCVLDGLFVNEDVIMCVCSNR